MSTPFLGQIMPAAFNFAPKNFALCNGATMSINQNQALFALLGTQFGGDGVTTFMLPDLRSRTPVGFSDSMPIGQTGGVENVTLTSSQLPAHTHLFNANTAAGTARSPVNGVYGNTGSLNVYGSSGGTQIALNAATLDNAGQTQPHSNMQPYTVLNFCIALTGVFPTHS